MPKEAPLSLSCDLSGAVRGLEVHGEHVLGLVARARVEGLALPAELGLGPSDARRAHQPPRTHRVARDLQPLG